MIPYQVPTYFKHFVSARSTAGHGIHSPFVYELATKVFRDSQSEKFPAIEDLRRVLLKDQRKIEIRDLGAGSLVHRSDVRTIASIARHSVKNSAIGRLLYRLALYTKAAHLLELGTSLGLTTAALAQTGKSVTTVEGCENIAEVAKTNFERLKIANIDLRVGAFDDMLPELLKAHTFEFVFVDGNHSYAATTNYFRQMRDNLSPGSVIIFDDIYWTREMNRAWKEIVADPKATVTIDLFHVGIVFLNKAQAKEHFNFRL